MQDFSQYFFDVICRKLYPLHKCWNTMTFNKNDTRITYPTGSYSQVCLLTGILLNMAGPFGIRKYSKKVSTIFRLSKYSIPYKFFEQINL